MRTTALNEITLMQYIVLIHSSQVGTGIFSLPRKIADSSGTDGWISILIAWAANTLAGCVILLVMRKYPDDTLPDLFRKLFGKAVGKLLLIPVIAYYSYYGFSVLVNSMLYIKAWFLPYTPGYLIVLLFAVPTFMIVRNGMRVLGRYVEIVFYMMAWMPLFLLIPLDQGHWIHLLPVLKEGWKPIVRGVHDTLFSFAGMETLFFIYPFLRDKKRAFHGLFIASSLTLVLYLFVTISCFVLFAPDEIGMLNQPLMNLLKTIEFRFLERFDMIFLALYLFVVSRCWILYSFSAIYSASRLFDRPDHTKPAAVFLVIAAAIVFVHQPTWNEADRSETVLTILNEWYMFAFPVVLYVAVKGKELLGRLRSE